MIPVILTKTDNYVGFLGSFDGIKWWKTQPLPGEVEYVLSAIWIYGQYHVCVAKMQNGTYSIYRSADNGFSWASVLNTVEQINTIISPEYGVGLAATSDGWLRSADGSGKTWTKISTQAPNCFCVKNISNGILIALSATSIWRSTDNGITWTSKYSPSIGFIYPAIDGTYYDCVVGVGNKLYYSSNGGDKFVLATGVHFNGPITDIELTSTFGGIGPYSDMVPTFVIQELLSNGMLRHYYVVRTPGNSQQMFHSTTTFDAISNLYNSLYSDESQITGSSDINRTVFFSGTLNGKPLLLQSINGGQIWTTVNISTAILYSGPDLSQISGTMGEFISNTYFAASWSHNNRCHNGWTITDTKYIRNQSCDYDILTSKNYHALIYGDIILAQESLKSSDYDILTNKTLYNNIIVNILNKKTSSSTLVIDTVNKKTFFKYPEYDTCIAVNMINDLEHNLLLKKLISLNFRNSIKIKKGFESELTMNIRIIDTHMDEILIELKKHTIQALDLVVPDLHYDPWDSRKTTPRTE